MTGSPGRRLASLLRQARCSAAAVVALPQAMRQQGCDLLDYGATSATEHSPVVLVHGYAATVGVWNPMRAVLAESGFAHLLALRYDTMGLDLPYLAEFLATAVTAAAERDGFDSVHLVGHSLGGLIVRLAVEEWGLGCDVATVVTIATPHRGSPLAWVGPGIAARRMRPGSSLLGAPKGADCHGRGPRYVNYYCARDSVVPRHSARLTTTDPGAAGAARVQVRNLRVEAAGHVGAMTAELVLSTLPAELLTSEREHLAGSEGRAVA